MASSAFLIASASFEVKEDSSSAGAWTCITKRAKKSYDYILSFFLDIIMFSVVMVLFKILFVLGHQLASV